MPAIYHEGSWLGNATDPEVLVKDTVGWTGKNLLKNTATTQTINGVTFTVNDDGSVTANGTATADIRLRINPPTNTISYDIAVPIDRGAYILSGGTSNIQLRLNGFTDSSASNAGWARNPADSLQSDEFSITTDTARYNVFAYIASGTTISNEIIYPMLRKADITDPTYEPYHESVEEEIEQIYTDNGVLGAKNLLKQLHGTETKNGVTFTQNTDGSITVNGTATANTGHEMIATGDTGINGSFKLPVGRYILSGCPKDGSWETCSLYLQMMDNNSTWLSPQYKDEGNGVEFDITETNKDYRFIVSIRVQNRATISNVKFYPMIRLASDPDDTYQPYAMTNRELTEKKINIADLKTVVSASSDFTDFKTRIASL